jgi:putative peptidoglycan lipid II flippase
MSAARASIGRGTVVMAAGTATSRVLGQVREIVLIWLIGATCTAANAFQLANSLPNILYNLLVSGALTAVLVPQVVRAYKRGIGQEYVNRLLTLGFVVLAALTVVLTAAVPLIVQLYGRGEGGQSRLALAVAFAWWTMPQIFFYGLYALLGQVLNARESFGPFMWAPVANNIVSIAVFALFAAKYGHWGNKAPEPALWTGEQIAFLAGGATLGIVVQALVLVPALRNASIHYRFQWGFRGIGLRSAWNATVWTFLGLLVGQIGVIATTQVAGAANDAADAQRLGVVAGLAVFNRAFIIFMLPHSLVTVSLLTALFPRLSSHAADKDHHKAAATLSQGVRVIGLFTVGAGGLGILLAQPLVRAMLVTIDTSAASVTVPVLIAFMVGLPAFGVWSACQRVYYAYENARGMLGACVGMAAVVALGTIGVWLVLPPSLWVFGAALSMSASYMLAVVMALFGLKRRLGTVGGSSILRTYLRATIALVPSFVTGLAMMWALRRLGVTDEEGVAGWFTAVATCLVVGAVSGGVYVALLKFLRVSELDVLLASIRRMVSRLRGSQSH